VIGNQWKKQHNSIMLAGIGMAGYVKSFRDLEVYKEARELARDVYEVSKTFPPEERFALTDQVRRSSRSVGGGIAEAWVNGDMPPIL